MRDSHFWRDKHIIITGASSGLGRALALYLSQQGARLGLIARRRELLEELAHRVRAGGAHAAIAVADVRDAAQTCSAIVVLEQALGPCDVLIANAGVHRYTPGDRFDVSAASDVLATNVLGVTHALGAVLPGMVDRRRGHIVAVGSIAGMLGLPDVGAYSASKAAVITLMESLRVDLRRCGVKVTTVCPGFIDTPMIADHDRRKIVFVLPVEEAARRIAGAVERGRAEYWFPWPTWLLARIGRAIPRGLYCRLVARLPRARGNPTGCPPGV